MTILSFWGRFHQIWGCSGARPYIRSFEKIQQDMFMYMNCTLFHANIFFCTQNDLFWQRGKFTQLTIKCTVTKWKYVSNYLLWHTNIRICIFSAYLYYWMTTFIIIIIMCDFNSKLECMFQTYIFFPRSDRCLSIQRIIIIAPSPSLFSYLSLSLLCHVSTFHSSKTSIDKWKIVHS